MYIVRNPTGAHLMVLGSVTILITSPQNLHNHVTQGKFPIIMCDEKQFAKYKDMRVDV